MSKEILGIFVSSLSSILYYDTLHKLGSDNVSFTFLCLFQAEITFLPLYVCRIEP